MKNARALILILICAVIIVAGWIAVRGFPGTINPGEVGVVIQGRSVKRVYGPGERPFVIPVLQHLCRVTTSAQVVTLTEEEAVRSGSFSVESQIIYSVIDAKKAVESFGPDETNVMIRKRLSKEVSSLLASLLVDPSFVNDDTKRMVITAQVHVGLRNAFEGTGVSVDSYQIRVR